MLRLMLSWDVSFVFGEHDRKRVRESNRLQADDVDSQCGGFAVAFYGIGGTVIGITAVAVDDEQGRPAAVVVGMVAGALVASFAVPGIMQLVAAEPNIPTAVVLSCLVMLWQEWDPVWKSD